MVSIFRRTACSFDESRFHMDMVHSRAWSKKGTSATVKVPTQRGVSLSTICCISSKGVILLSKRDLIPLKKRKAVGKQPSSNIGTTSDHFHAFVEKVMDISDAHKMQDMHILMDNARIYHSASVLEAIEKRGYKPLFLPPYSPFLNPRLIIPFCARLT